MLSPERLKRNIQCWLFLHRTHPGKLEEAGPAGPGLEDQPCPFPWSASQTWEGRFQYGLRTRGLVDITECDRL